MNIIILGAGTVGLSLARHLCGLTHHVTIIEKNKTLCEAITNGLDVSTINGVGSDPTLLEEANIQNTDMLIAVTPSDETNLLACNFAMQNGVKKRITRVKSEIYTTPGCSVNLKDLGVTHVIEPEKEVVRKVIQYVQLPGVIESANFQSNHIYLRGYQITEDMPIAYKTLAETRQLAKDSPLLIVAITREGQSVAPTGNQKILPGDKIIAIMPKESFKTFCFFLNRKTNKLKKIVVAGDSLTAVHLAESLKPFCEKIILLDPDPDHAHQAASQLEGVTVYHGDITDSAVLHDISLGHIDFFIAASEDAEDNVMACLMAKAEGAKETLTIRDKDSHIDLFSTLGIDYIVSPQDATLKMIIENIQPVSIGAYLKLKTSDIHVTRLRLHERSAILGKSLKELDTFFKKKIIIGCIIRQNAIIIPRGETVMEANDEALVICQQSYIERTKKLFTSKANRLLNPYK